MYEDNNKDEQSKCPVTREDGTGSGHPITPERWELETIEQRAYDKRPEVNVDNIFYCCF